MEHFPSGSIFSWEVADRDSLAPFPQAAVDKTSKPQVTQRVCACVCVRACMEVYMRVDTRASTVSLGRDIREPIQ